MRVFAALVLLMAGTAHASEEEVRAMLDAFLDAFENGDLIAMEAAFADDSVTFPRTIMSKSLTMDIDVEDYRRVTGIDPQMRMVIETFKEMRRHPPFMELEPEDMKIQLYGDVAVATFHLAGERRLGRRTFVLAKLDGEWKIVHLHASNVVGDRE